MSHPFVRNALSAVACTALSIACSDKPPPRTPEDVPPLQQSSTPGQLDQSPAPTSSNEPTNMPPSSPPPQNVGEAASQSGAAAAQTTSESARTRLSEAQVARITELANTAEVEQGKLAQSKAKAPEVKKFAAMMVKHHTEAKTEQAKLYKDIGLTPSDSQRATTLKDSADRTLGQLRAGNGTSFDVAYIDAQVNEHQELLDTINGELLPAAMDEKLISGLTKMKATVEDHLKEAKALQADLASRSSNASR